MKSQLLLVLREVVLREKPLLHKSFMTVLKDAIQLELLN